MGDGAWTIDVTLRAEPQSIARARQMVASGIGEIDVDSAADLAIVVSELVTNALRHGRPDIVLRLRRSPDRVLIAIVDHGDGVPEVRQVSETATSGRGLAIVQTIATQWGCDSLGSESGKIVWAVLSASR